MPRRFVSSALLAVGLLSALVGYAALVLRSTVLDESAAAASARAALAEPSVRSELTTRAADATVTALVGAEEATALRARGIDVRRDAATVTASLLDAPAFLDAYDAAVRRLHEHVLHDPTAAPRLDLGELVPVMRERLVDIDPAYDAILVPRGPLIVTLPTDELPDLTAVDRTLTGTRSALAMIAGAAGCLAGLLLASPDGRRRQLRRAGTLLVAVGLLQLAGSYAVHLALERGAGTTASVVRVTLQPMLGRLALPGFVPLALGALTVAVAHRRAGRPALRMADHGRVAFLTDPSGRPTEWRFDAAFEPEMLRTAPSTLAHHR
jgi:hypothetical protein